MPPQQQQQQPRNQQPQSPLGQALGSAMKLGEQVMRTASNIDKPVDVLDKSLAVGQIILDGNKSVIALDRAVGDLEKSAPGTTQVVKDLGEALNSASGLIDIRNVPNGLKPVSRDLQSASKEFKEFTEAYDNYEKTKGLSNLNPFNYGKKAAAASEVAKEWKEFKGAWNPLGTNVPPQLKDPMIQQAAKDGVQLLRDLIK